MHTLGPWRVTDEPQDDELFYNIESGTDKKDGWIIARVWADAEELSSQAEANARLIACTPELLIVLNQAIAFLMNPQAFDKEGLEQDWRELKRKVESK